MRSTLDVLVGSQTPRLLVTPPSSGTAGHDLIELCEGVGMEFYPAQKLALVEICAEASPGKWAAMETLVEECRQNGKGLLIEALQLGDLFLFDSLLSTYSAHEFPTAMEHHRRLCFWIENNDDLRKRCHKPTTGSNNVAVETLSGRRVKFRARTNDGGRGLTGDRVILDEAFDLPKQAIGAMVPTLSAVPNPQINYFSSAGFGVDQPKSDVLWDIRKQALVKALQHVGLPVEEPEGQFHARGVPGAHVYLCHSASPSALSDLHAEEHVAEANPAYGRRIFWGFIQEVEQRRMTHEAYARERLGIWDGTRKLVVDEADGLVEIWRQRAWPGSTPGERRDFGVDVSPDQRSAAIWVVGESSAGGRHCELVEFRAGSDWVAARCAELQGKWGGRVGVDPSGPAGAVLQQLEDAGVVVTRPSGREMQAACEGLVAAIKAVGQVRHRVPSQWEGVVHSALAGAVRKPAGDGGFTWSRRSSAVDISPLVALTVAWHLAGVPVEAPADRPVFAY